MTRVAVLAALRVAGYHADTKAFARLYVENHVSYAMAKKMWNEGAALKQKGMACTCYACARTLVGPIL